LFVFGGDVRQALPIVTKGERVDTVTASISRSSFLPYYKVMHLMINMRLMHPHLGHDEYKQLRHFADWILSVGSSTLEGISLQEGSEANWIQVPSKFLIPDDNHGLDNLISEIYPKLSTRYNDSSYMQERCTFAATNNDVD